MARSLARRGHRIVYAAPARFEAYIRTQGFDFVAVLEDRAESGRDDDDALTGQLETINGSFVEALRSGALDAVFARVQPDLVLSDVFTVPVTLAAHRAGLRVVNLNIILPLGWDLRVPPLRSPLIPRPTLVSRARVVAAWLSLLATKRLRRRRYPSPDWTRLARECGYPPSEVDSRAMFQPHLRATTQIVLCPKEFDFPRPVSPRIVYGEPSIDLDRADDSSFPWQAIEAGRRLVYCALGTNTGLYDAAVARRFLQTAVDAIGGLRDCQLVIAAAADLAPRVSSCRQHVVVVARAPQIRLLERAALMITHGGLGSIKESIALGVPMIVFPFALDQPGNAARVEFHRLGLRADVRTVTVDELRRLVRRALEDRHATAGIEAMRARFLAADRAEPGAHLVHDLLSA